MAQVFSYTHKDMPILSVLCSPGYNFCSEEEQVKVYPSLRLYNKTRFIQYSNNLSSFDFILWLKDRIDYSLISLDDLIVENLI